MYLKGIILSRLAVYPALPAMRLSFRPSIKREQVDSLHEDALAEEEDDWVREEIAGALAG